jgi:HD-GYP domain-containing protein (c-di-GMP phosphodiesterase class II)
VLLAQAAGFSERQQSVLEYASLFHDIGKIGIPDAILMKPARLSPEEEEIMREHPVKSASILAPLESFPFFQEAIAAVLHHHERIDGQGYPFGLQGDQIPITARIILIADTYDAMTTTRPYRKGLPVEYAYSELKKFAGRQFDEQLVKTFLSAHPKWNVHEVDFTDHTRYRLQQKTNSAKKKAA